jgi:hypothetical protein
MGKKAFSDRGVSSGVFGTVRFMTKSALGYKNIPAPLNTFSIGLPRKRWYLTPPVLPHGTGEQNKKCERTYGTLCPINPVHLYTI